MPDSFTPLVPLHNGSRETTVAATAFQGLGVVAATVEVSATKTNGNHSQECSDPVVSVQRSGDSVISIRVQCGCGQVIDLACVY